MTSLSLLESRAAGVVADAFPTKPMSLRDVGQRIAELRGRPLSYSRSDPGPLAAKLPTGIWLVTAETDIIWVNSTLSVPHQVTIAGHEFGHVLCGHRPVRFDDAGATHDGLTRDEVADLVGIPCGRHVRAVIGRCGNLPPAGDALARLREDEAEATGRLLVRPFLASHEAGLAALLRGH